MKPEQRSARARQGGMARSIKLRPDGRTRAERLAAGGAIAREAALDRRWKARTKESRGNTPRAPST